MSCLSESLIESNLSNFGHSTYSTTPTYAYLNLELINKELTDIKIIKDYIHIQYLNLSTNKLEHLSNLYHLKSLKKLIVSKNHIKNFLDFGENKESNHDDITSSIRTLNYIDYSYNNITDLGSYLSNHIFLEYIDLSHNQLENLVHISILSNLKYLNVSHNQITNILPIKNKVLKQLNLSFNCINSLEHLNNNLYNLKMINLANNQLSKLDGLHKLLNINEIYLANNVITQINEIYHLQYLSQLDVLDLTGNPIQNLADYRLRIIYLLPNLISLDHCIITKEEIIEANNLHGFDILYRTSSILYHLPYLHYTNQDNYNNQLHISKKKLKNMFKTSINQINHDLYSNGKYHHQRNYIEIIKYLKNFPYFSLDSIKSLIIKKKKKKFLIHQPNIGNIFVNIIFY